MGSGICCEVRQRSLQPLARRLGLHRLHTLVIPWNPISGAHCDHRDAGRWPRNIAWQTSCSGLVCAGAKPRTRTALCHAHSAGSRNCDGEKPSQNPPDRMRTSSRVYGSSDVAEKLFAPELRSIAVNQFDSQLTRAPTCRKHFSHARPCPWPHLEYSLGAAPAAVLRKAHPAPFDRLLQMALSTF